MSILPPWDAKFKANLKKLLSLVSLDFTALCLENNLNEKNFLSETITTRENERKHLVTVLNKALGLSLTEEDMCDRDTGYITAMFQEE
jgi:hypothetical protein